MLKDVNASMAGIGSTPYTAEWNWMSVCANKDASPTLDDATLTMDGVGAGNVHAIYFCNNNKLNLKNGSSLTIENYKQDAVEWDGGDSGYNVNIEGSSTYNLWPLPFWLYGHVYRHGRQLHGYGQQQRSHRHHLR